MGKYLIGVIACGIILYVWVWLYGWPNSSQTILEEKTVESGVSISEAKSPNIGRETKTVDRPNTREGTQTVRDVASRERVERTYTMTATAYCLNKDNTASGLRPGPGRVAVDPKIIKLGTRMYIEGYGECVAADTGADIKGMRCDVWFVSEQRCIKWGRKPVKVVVYGKGK